MFGGDGDKIRAFPFKSTPEPGGLTDYVELSGCNGILIEAVKRLYEVPNKPENPIEWLRLYFKYQAEDVAAGKPPTVIDGSRDTDSDFTRDMDEVEQMLKLELTEIQSEIINCFEEEAQNKAIIERLEHEAKHVTMGLPRDHWHENFVKYLDQHGDYHYRIRPDPMYQASTTDMLLDQAAIDKRGGFGAYGRGGGGGFGGGAPLKQDDSIVELVPFDSSLWMAAAMHHGLVTHSGPHATLSREEENKVYADYPQLYFPERQKQVKEEAEDENEEEDEDELEEEEDSGAENSASEMMSESDAGNRRSIASDSIRAEKGKGRSAGGGVMESSEYDGGSEGGESDQSRVKSGGKKERSPYTPRNAHETRKNLKDKDKQSQKSPHKTSDKNV